MPRTPAGRTGWCGSASYLDIDAVVAAARESGAGYVHPGYGFLSERAPFARALAEAGITLVGPSADVMDAMGRKDAARDVAVAAGVPVVPSYSLRSDDPATFSYPVLVKAAAGGGGKGMRVVRSAGDYDEAFAAAQREARSSFGDDTILVEKYVESGRHIEVQVMGDTHGTVLHFFERDCSTQRRHQKVLEEAPAPTISEEQRAAITSSAVALAEQCGYTGAGTVEFLLDNATGEFFFLEMNTRLQVEHPVTEEVVRVRTDQGSERVDLVELQLRVATGEPLGVRPGRRHPRGPRDRGPRLRRGLLQRLPAPGRPHVDRAVVVRRRRPRRPRPRARAGGQHLLRPDARQGHRLGADPRGGDRRPGRTPSARPRSWASPPTRASCARWCRPRSSATATIDTAWLDRNEVPAPDPALARVFAAWTEVLLDTMPAPASSPGPWRADGWRMGADPAPDTVVLGDDLVVVDRHRGQVTHAGATHDVRLVSAADHTVHLLVDGRPEHAVLNVQRGVVDVVHRGQRWAWERPDPFGDHAVAAGDGTLLAPMPGTVLAVNVAEGQAVAEGETLGVMEAMKMELALKAPFAGTVTTVGAATGDLVKLGAVLFTVEPLR